MTWNDGDLLTPSNLNNKGIGGILNVKEYGAKGDGVTNDLTAFNNALAAAVGKILFVPRGTYIIAGKLSFAGDNTSLIADGRAGTVLSFSSLGAATIGSYGAGTAAIDVGAYTNCAIRGIHIKGPSALATYTSNETGILAVGASTSSRVDGLIVEDCEISRFGSYGGFCQFVDNIQWRNNYIHDCGYSGAFFLSCNNGRFISNTIKTITPGTSGDAYGMSLTHYSVGYNADPNAGLKTATHPFCSGWLVQGNHVEDVLNTGLDAHGIYDTEFSFNHVYNTKRAMAPHSGSGDATGYAGWHNRVVFNVCDARKPDGTASGRENLGVGIEVGNSLSTTYHADVVVAFNAVHSHGLTSGAGAIRSNFTRRARIVGNSIYNWGGRAIEAGPNATLIEGNIIGDVATAGDTAKRAIESQPGITTGKMTVRGNVLVSDGGTAPLIGFHYADLTTRPIISDNDFALATSTEITASSTGFFNGSDYPQIRLVTNNGATQDVGAFQPGVIGILRFEYTAPTTVTNLTGGYDGQIVVLQVNNANAVTFDRSNARLAGSANWVGAQYGTLKVMLVGAVWHEISRSANG